MNEFFLITLVVLVLNSSALLACGIAILIATLRKK